jgi:hypothetical protein
MKQDDRAALISRIGTFFFLLGVLGIILFVATDIAKQTDFRYFFLAILLLVAGLVFKRSGKIPTPPNNRFEGLRKLRQKSSQSNKKDTKEIKR